jgi:hypothetical protein
MTRDQLIQWAEEKAKTLIADDLQYEVDDHDAPVIAATLVEAYEAGMEHACKAMCTDCKNGLDIHRKPDGSFWHTVGSRTGSWPCTASAIRAAMEEGKDG